MVPTSPLGTPFNLANNPSGSPLTRNCRQQSQSPAVQPPTPLQLLTPVPPLPTCEPSPHSTLFVKGLPEFSTNLSEAEVQNEDSMDSTVSPCSATQDPLGLNETCHMPLNVFSKSSGSHLVKHLHPIQITSPNETQQ